jgi:hypothetical protein
MCSSQFRSFLTGTVAAPSSCHDWPRSAEATTMSLFSRPQIATGRSQRPSASTVGLFIMIPSQIQRGFDQVGFSSPELSVVMASSCGSPWPRWAQKSHKRPCGSCQRHGSNARTGPSRSGSRTAFKLDQVWPSSPLVTSIT